MTAISKSTPLVNRNAIKRLWEIGQYFEKQKSYTGARSIYEGLRANLYSMKGLGGFYADWYRGEKYFKKSLDFFLFILYNMIEQLFNRLPEVRSSK